MKLAYWSLVFVSVFFICSAGSCALGLARAQEIRPETMKTLEKPKVPQKELVERLLKMNDECTAAGGCELVPKPVRQRERENLEDLLRRIADIEILVNALPGCI